MKPYLPDSLPLQNLDYRRLLGLVGDATSELARYDGLLQGIPNPTVILSPLTTREAVLSSKIEGTQATVGEVLEQEAGLIKEGEKYKDIQEISNYRAAFYQARDYPIRLGFICRIHKVLMDSVRGENKTQGEFRRGQNWVGKAGCTIDEAFFVPPDPLQLPDHLNALERYLDVDDINFILQTAVVHAQFELLHPFLDGNGRIGRILIPPQYSVYLLDAIFSKPVFRVSDTCKQLNGLHGIHEKTAADLLRQLKDAGILNMLQPGKGRRSATFCFPELINMAEGRQVV